MKPSGPVFDASWRSACRLERVPRSAVHHMIEAHYLKKWPGVCVLTLGVRRHEHLIGVIVFALPPRETAKRYGVGVCWELARLWVHDAVPKNAETWVIAQAVRWIRKNAPAVGALVSYADPSAGHAGTIYKAANWKADGRTDDERKTPRFDYVDERTGKRYSRRAHVPADAVLGRVARVSKHRFVLAL